MRWITETILRRYGIAGSILSEEELRGGNVNRTYCVYVRDGRRQTRYLVQKLNPEAVRQPRVMLRNMVVVTDHLLRKGIRTAKLYPVGVSGERFLELRRHAHGMHGAGDGATHSAGTSGSAFVTEYWRVEEYLEAVDVSPEDNDVLLAMARAFGQFDAALADMPRNRLQGTGQGFHDTHLRFRQLWKAAEEDVCGRTAEVRAELASLKMLEEEACEVSLRYAAGEFPVRITPNDTKIKNVLFTDAKPPYGAIVIDFDTVMEGLIAYDFADSVRSTAKKVGGDADTPTAQIDLEKFRIIAEGYLAETGDILTAEEIAGMAPGTLAVTAELAARYLTDFLAGDRYFKIEEPLQNLRKARLNLAFAQDIRGRMEKLQSIVAETAGRFRFG